ncbi:MAG: hypothetical protein RLZZ536_1048 [Planctomycetota bacterium]|jgi:hypothetical protein
MSVGSSSVHTHHGRFQKIEIQHTAHFGKSCRKTGVEVNTSLRQPQITSPTAEKTQECRQRNDKPGSVAGVHFSRMPIARHLQQPTRRSANRTDPRQQMLPDLLLGLAPDGVYPARRSPVLLVRSYRTVSPLPRRSETARPSHHRSAVCFLLHFPDPRGRWVLPTTVSCGARTFL